MQQANYPLDETTSELANAAPAHLNPSTGPFEPQAPSTKHTFAGNPRHPLNEAAPVTPTDDLQSGPTGASEQYITAEIKAPTASLPSLLRYVDHVLMRDKHCHNHPPHTAQKCVRCNQQWNKMSVPSTFFPTPPCNHWIHYRCLIALAIRDTESRRGSCYYCNTPLYEWDGINVLILATRTDLTNYVMVNSDRDQYEQECDVIEKVIERRFLRQITKPSSFSDHSPDLVECFNDALNDLRLMGRPTSRWLTWSTTTGFFLFHMLVAIKTQRFLTERHGRIKQTEAWVVWEEGCLTLQAAILNEVHRE